MASKVLLNFFPILLLKQFGGKFKDFFSKKQLKTVLNWAAAVALLVGH
jgi:hypothetical protein